MVDVKQAIMIAGEFLKEIYGGSVDSFLLEEVEYDDDEDVWLVTMSFVVAEKATTNDQLPTAHPLYQYIPERIKKQYKVVRIDAESGKPISMKMREFA